MKNNIIIKALNDYLYKMDGFFPEINEEGEIECEVDNFARSLPETAPFLKTLKEQSTEYGNVAGAVYYIISGITVYMVYSWERFMGLQ